MSVLIRIQLDPGQSDDPDWERYRVGGDRISGQVVVETDELIECRAVRIAGGWHTEGKGDRDEEVIYATTLHKGKLNATHQFPFETMLPEQPISYSGHHIKVIWTATATVDLAWQKDPRAEEMFFVLPIPADTASLGP